VIVVVGTVVTVIAAVTVFASAEVALFDAVM